MGKLEEETVKSVFKQGFLLRSREGFNLKNLGYLPRWVIFLIDILTVTFSGVVTFYLFKGLGLEYFDESRKVMAFGLYVGLNIFFFWWFKTYSGIIRHSSFIDAIKIFFSQLAVFLVMLAVKIIFSVALEENIFIVTALLINIIFNFCLLFLYRVLVKQIFEVYFKGIQSGQLVNALVYGADANAISVTNALMSEIPTRFKLLGFIDKYSLNESKQILGLPIINQKKKISVIMKSLQAEALIIADKGLSKEEQLAIVDDCLEYNLKVYTVPLISNWENQKEISQKIKSFQIEDLLDRKPIVLDNKMISAQLNNKTIMITGAAGSIGSEIVRQVLEFNPKTVIILDQAETPLHELTLEIQKLLIQTNIVSVVADIRDKSGLEKLFELYRPNLIYHAAAYKHVPLMEDNPSQAILVNVMGTQNLADLALAFGVEKFVMVSTDKAVNPSNVMGASKRIAEKYVQSLYFHELEKNKETTKFITTRFGNVLGSNGSVVPLFSKQIAEGGPVTITHKEIIRFFMTIPEACQLVLEAGAMGNGGEIYMFDMGKPVKIYDLAKKMIRLAGYVPDSDIQIKVVGLRPGEKLYEELLNDTSKTLPTHHEKIMVAQEEIDAFEKVSEAIADIMEASSQYNNHLIVTKMKALVPEFKSLNSIFEILDKKNN
ncbi:polysaccharide biosynthesis protein [Flavobacterium sp. HXWNR70]|uniref:Polysaccharide biosynthesis protein n=1 Tax=Flavobacterium luminosum TaxID=2949086 RepID=A0ABT0TNM6_9FLAO|nr:nucleoside-diphosphate sugar epimerase/dehydratase [Flavobacterium sp. HXWNR70]MCL9809109.1 polysaccharide biosynthesis protein [Flavobacterium sp. HXWNR70]